MVHHQFGVTFRGAMPPLPPPPRTTSGRSWGAWLRRRPSPAALPSAPAARPRSGARRCSCCGPCASALKRCEMRMRAAGRGRAASWLGRVRPVPGGPGHLSLFGSSKSGNRSVQREMIDQDLSWFFSLWFLSIHQVLRLSSYDCAKP